MQPILKSLPSSLYLQLTSYVYDYDYEVSNETPTLAVTEAVVETDANSISPSTVSDKVVSNSFVKVEVYE